MGIQEREPLYTGTATKDKEVYRELLQHVYLWDLQQVQPCQEGGVEKVEKGDEIINHTLGSN
jgi:hypothetical protein